MDAIEKRARELLDSSRERAVSRKPRLIHMDDAIHAIIAALRPPEGHVVVTRNEAGQAVAVTRQDDDGRILSVIAEFEDTKGDMGNPISVPDGYVLVPVRPTDAIEDAVESIKMPHAYLRTGIRIADFHERYSAMIAARPEVP